jgi:hypothetical protein
MKTPSPTFFGSLCEKVFATMEANLRSRNEVLFWSAGSTIPALQVIEAYPANGIWFAGAKIDDRLTVKISVGLMPHELRVGVVIPAEVVDVDADPSVEVESDLMVDLSHDGKVNDNLRETSDGYLYDRTYCEAPFTPQWMRDAYHSDEAAEIIAISLSGIVANTWRTAFEVLARKIYKSRSQAFMLTSKDEIQIQALKKQLPVIVTGQGQSAGMGNMVTCLFPHGASELTTLLREKGFDNVSVVEDSAVA